VLTSSYSEQEYKRHTESSNIDDRTMHEIYAHPFLKSVMAGIGSMMCSYSAFFFHFILLKMNLMSCLKKTCLMELMHATTIRL
jgi:beta-glucosidase-like glycosyl hydrolase